MSDTKLTAEITQNGQLRLTAKDNLNNTVLLSLNEKVKSLNAFNWSVVVGMPGTYKVVNHHFTDVYTVSTLNGTVSVSEGIVTYTPALLGSGGFWLNGTYVPVTVVQDSVGKPSITSPSNESVAASLYPELTSTDFKAQNPAMTHTYSRWQVAKDSGFTNIVYDTTDAVSLTRLKLPRLKNGQKYYVRVCHFGTKP